MIPAELAQIREILQERVGSIDEALALRVYNDFVDLNGENHYEDAHYPTLEAIINRYLAGPDPGIVPY